MYLDITLDSEYRGEGPWRCYQLSAHGKTLDQLMLNATIAEVDQDGGDLDFYELEDAPNSVIEEAKAYIIDLYVAKQKSGAI